MDIDDPIYGIDYSLVMIDNVNKSDTIVETEIKGSEIVVADEAATYQSLQPVTRATSDIVKCNP